MIAEPFSSTSSLEEQARARVIILLTASTALGFICAKWLPEEHLSEQSMHAIRLVTGLLVTFVALVLSFELSTVKATFDTAYRDRAQDAAQIGARSDQCLRNFGSEGDEARKNIRAYTAAVIASTWPNEAKPEGVENPDTSTMAQRGENPTLGGLLNQVGLEIKALSPSDKFHENIAAECRSDFADLLTMRWTCDRGRAGRRILAAAFQYRQALADAGVPELWTAGAAQITGRDRARHRGAIHFQRDVRHR